MRVLVDTSVWIDHLHAEEAEWTKLLLTDQVLMHPFVHGELACGSLKRRAEVLAYMGYLPSAPVASLDEVLHLISTHHLMGRGLGFVDMHLLAAVRLMPGARLWTRDKRLKSVADLLGGSVDIP